MDADGITLSDSQARVGKKGDGTDFIVIDLEESGQLEQIQGILVEGGIEFNDKSRWARIEESTEEQKELFKEFDEVQKAVRRQKFKDYSSSYIQVLQELKDDVPK